MRPKDSISYAAAIVAAGLLATAPSRLSAQASQTAPKSSENEECRGNGCAASPDAPVAESDAGAPAKPYDWKASFKEYKVGKVPRLADGHPDMQGIWSRTTLVPMERPRNQDKKEIDAATAAKLENEAQQKQFDLRTEPTDTPPGEKTTDAYNTFWRDGYWFKVPMSSLRTSQVVDPPNGRLPPLTLAARVRQNRAAELDNRRATSYEDRPMSSRCIQRPGTPGPAFNGSGPGGQESTLEIIQGTDTVLVRGESLVSQVIYMDTNFPGADGGRRHLTARYKLLDANHLLFGYTSDDPGARTKPFSVEFVMWKLTDQEQLVEYACHEGNVGLEFTLSAARAKDREEAADEGK
jgi:hypothetical protein